MDALTTRPELATPPDGRAPTIAGAIERGGRIGRYLVLQVQGVGAMGIVYVAYDPELDRKLAVKVLHGCAADERELLHALLIREARALARVSHPNVITVHDVGVHEQQVFIAMELVPGVELGAWLAERARADSAPPWRRWRELREPLLAAGRGLAAAHAVGLVHRDFKPTNVLVGPAGVRVLDFGLARAHADPESPTPIHASRAAAPTLTATGAIVGTPAYMAPEVHDAAPADVRADQYAYCVTLYEALLGQRPFLGLTGPALALAKREPGPWLAHTRVLPTFLRQLLARGLDPTPARRFADMDALLAALARDPAARRRRIAGATLVGLALAAGLLVRTRDAPAACTGGERHAAAVWNETRADGLRAALPDDQAARVITTIDAHLAAWRDTYAAACAATFVAREQSPALFDRRLACLHERLDEVDALLTVLARRDPSATTRAAEAASQLTPPTRCDGEALLAELEAPPPGDAAELARVLAQLRSAEALERAGLYAHGLQLARFTEAQARRLGPGKAHAEALLRLGTLCGWTGDYAGAEAALAEAATLAASRRYEDLAATAAVELVFLLGYQRSRFAEARVWWQVATAAAERSGHPDRHTPQLWNHWGAVLEARGDYEAGRQAYAEALQRWQRSRGPDHPDATPTLNNLAVLETRLGRFTEALTHHHQALEIRERAYGPDHPEVANSHNSIGTALLFAGRPAEARTHLERALAIYARMLRPEPARVAVVLGNLGAVHLAEHDPRGAVQAHSRALAMLHAALGPTDPAVARARHNLGFALLRLGEHELARRQLELALTLRRDRLGPEHPDVALTLAALAELQLARGACEASRDLLLRALTIHERGDPPTQPNHAGALVLLGDAWRCDGHSARAREVYSRALTLLDEHPQHPFRALALAGLGHAALQDGELATGRTLLTEALADPDALAPDRLAELRHALAP